MSVFTCLHNSSRRLIRHFFLIPLRWRNRQILLYITVNDIAHSITSLVLGFVVTENFSACHNGSRWMDCFCKLIYIRCWKWIGFIIRTSSGLQGGKRESLRFVASRETNAKALGLFCGWPLFSLLKNLWHFGHPLESLIACVGIPLYTSVVACILP